MSVEEEFSNAVDLQENGVKDKPLLELYVKASGIDHRRIGACLFCQEFWMELYALYELGKVRVKVNTVNVNSEPFKKNFLGAQPPIMVEPEKGPTTYTDNRELEGRIFHIAKDEDVPLFEKDTTVEKKIENLYRNFKVLLKCKTDHEKGEIQVIGASGESAIQSAANKLLEQLANINQLLESRGTRYLLGSSMTQYDCELMPRLHHIRVAGAEMGGVDIPHTLVHLWNYLLTAYRTAAFIESCPADQDILHHYKDQLSMGRKREQLEEPTKTHTIPEEVLEVLRTHGLDQL
jgi:hypothetical protein